MNSILLDSFSLFWISTFSKARLSLELILLNNILISTVDDHSGEQLIKISSKLFGSSFDLIFILGKDSSPKFGVTKSSFLLKICVNTVIKKYDFNIFSSIF